MTAPSSVLDLVERFQRDLPTYKSGLYNETQARQEFIDPLFEALGWDIGNRGGAAAAYRDVVLEYSMKIGDTTKAPDYLFRVGGANRFFVEAKKPSVNLREGIAPAYQVRRYAWTAGLPLSVLTDFEEFAIYDCRVEPDKNDKAAVARYQFYSYEEYADKWNELAELFSREAVLAGSLEKFAQEQKAPKGALPVDKAFLAEIDGWRALLAKNIAIWNSELSQRELNYAVQMTLDRLIFLRIGEDRGIEPYGKLQGLLKGGEVYKRLAHQFQDADDRYNSGLFHFKEERGREGPDNLTLGLHIDDEPLKKVISSLYYPDSPYEFSVLPIEVLGNVYEQFLGKVITIGAERKVEVEEKPEVRKAGGVYYTPAYIVEYIVKNTVGKLLEGKTLREAAKLRIADPACGSGSFLIGAYQYLLDWHLAQCIADGPQKHKKELYQGAGGDWRLTTAARRDILLKNIYGVDIDAQAVEVTKLSLALKMLEGETEQTLGFRLSGFQERALPDLGNNIKCGNSLIGPDFYDNQQTTLLTEDDQYRINVFDWGAEFPKIMRADGFDAVIGNPPYGAFLSEQETTHLLNKYVFQEYQLDTYLLFVEKAFSLIKPAGLLGMIIPNTWLSNLLSKQIREYVFNRTQIERIVHYRYFVFPKAKVDTEVTIIQKCTPNEKHNVEISVVEKNGTTSTYTIPQSRWSLGKGKPVNIFERPELETLANKLRSLPILDNCCVITQGSKPFQVGKGKPPQTRQIVDEKPYVSEEQKDASFRPLLRGSLIQRYQTLWKNDYWISFGDWLAEPRYSARYDAPEKIIIRQTGFDIVATLDRKQFIARDNLYTIVEREGGSALSYVLGIINSRLTIWYYQTIINPEKGEALAQVKRGHVAQFPIVTDFTAPADKARHDQIVALVERMLDLHRRLPAAKTAQERTVLQRQIESTDRQIDNLVYDLYGLTPEEREIVEGATK